MMKRIPLVAMTVFAAGSLILIAANKPLVAPTPAQPRPIQKVYAVADLNAWADVGTRTSTSDPGKGTVLPAKRHAPIPYAGKERR